jgi:cation diffusion facilitator family transporter
MFGLLLTALVQAGLVLVTSSVALLTDTLHNLGDAATAVPLWLAFVLARRKPSERFTYGYGRVEDLAGILIVLLMFVSGTLAAYVSITGLLHPKPVQHLGALTAAALVGFLGNELVARLRIRVGREIGSAAWSRTACTRGRTGSRAWAYFWAGPGCGLGILRPIRSWDS